MESSLISEVSSEWSQRLSLRILKVVKLTLNAMVGILFGRSIPDLFDGTHQIAYHYNNWKHGC
jgi:hypothetical protein